MPDYIVDTFLKILFKDIQINSKIIHISLRFIEKAIHLFYFPITFIQRLSEIELLGKYIRLIVLFPYDRKKIFS